MESAGMDTPPPAGSYALLGEAARKHYFAFYKHIFAGQGRALDRKTRELVAIAASLAVNCNNCLDGHIKKARQSGATEAEIAEVVEVTLAVSAAAIVDRADGCAARLGT